ncbi:MAG: Bug family tripartite tricarboxylate transporter substrate binding protein [Beijerinckiaceae bacterium]
MATPGPHARADDFYDKKQIAFVIGYNPGGGYDIYARIIATALPRYIPGNPVIVPRNMPGAGSAVAANFLAGPAPRDGLTIGMIGQQLSLAQALNDPVVKFDMRQFNWLGRVASNVEVTVVWHTSPVKTIADATQREVSLAATSAGSTSHAMPLLVSRVTGARFKLVTGYPGITGGGLAMERGETQGTHATVDGLLFAKRAWMEEGKVSVLVQYAMERHPAHPNTPAMTELAKTPEDRAILNLFASPAEIGRSVMTPPGVPARQVRTLRDAFSAMLDDPVFAAELKAKNLTFEPMKGAELQKLIATALDLSPELVERAKAVGRE